AMPDLTQAFRATVAEITASGTVVPRPTATVKTRPPKATPDAWLKEAHQISKTMADLRAFIITIRPAYLNLSRNTGMNGLRLPQRSDSIPKHQHATISTSSKALQNLLDAVSSLNTLSDKDRDSIDTQVRVMMMQIKGAIEDLERLEQERRKQQQKNTHAAGGLLAAGLTQLMAAVGGPSGGVDNLAQHRQGVVLYLNERLAGLATLHKDQHQARMAREMEKRESSLFKALPKPTSLGTNSGSGGGRNGLEGSGGATGLTRRNQLPSSNIPGAAPEPSSRSAAAGTIGSSKVDAATGYSSSQFYQQSSASNFNRHQNHGPLEHVEEEDDFEKNLTAEERQMLEMENENIVQRLETELNQVKYA
ncbi:hypothetical protein BGZ94_009232, partial [Podila epigama]